jgi:predicted phosphohydrolase
VYPAERKLSSDEVNAISNWLMSFTEQWAAHNEPLKSSFMVKDEHFIVLAVDEQHNEASGCSIDTSARTLQMISEKTGIDFFTRTNVAFWINNTVQLVRAAELSRKRDEGLWDANSLMCNTAVLTVGDLKANWLVRASETWLKRYLKTQNA